MDDQTISGKCRRIRQHLTDLLTTLDYEPAQATTTTTTTTVTASSIKDVLERFMLWAGNLGALRKPTSKLSLDSRLASSPDLLDYICTELDDMAEAVGDLMNLVNGTQPDREVGYSSGSENDFDMQSDESSCSDDSFDEAASVLEVVSQTIASLLKVGILVRQPASSGTDRFHRASRDSTNAFLDRFDIDYVQHKHPKLGTGDQSSRLGKAIATRRQFIRYCRDHKSNLAAEEKEMKDPSNPQIGSQKATTAKQSSKATTFIARANLIDAIQGSVDALEEEDDTVSRCSVSTTSESLAVLKLPRLVELSPDDDPFECPICYTLQQFRSEQAWRQVRHAYRDLKAYVCTVGGTECNDKFFDDRTSWFNHELEQHRSRYACVLCGDRDGQGLRQRNELKQHILNVHGKFDSDQLELLEDAGRNAVIDFKADDCPFCDDWSALIAKRMPPGRDTQPEDGFTVNSNRFKKHVAMHLEQLAIFALPRHQHRDDQDEDGSNGSDSRALDSRSSASLRGSFASRDDQDIQEEQDDDNAPSWQHQVTQAVDFQIRSQPTPTTGWQATDITIEERVQYASDTYETLLFSNRERSVC
ncbi:hypothetical protein B0T20DRAFT_349290 [Sordaria brevicollis]|uniref:Oxidoreductase acuF-like C2H2 type zinc-finger domain-containing protein n=1 Tax=Sordaria brevicollis TaxID=83679 RepID=A0AAE0PGK0_SORBR|nr:hypothetical protein B0T20DRAFT_349290 [Sordaria brevicollis]